MSIRLNNKLIKTFSHIWWWRRERESVCVCFGDTQCVEVTSLAFSRQQYSLYYIVNFKCKFMIQFVINVLYLSIWISLMLKHSLPDLFLSVGFWWNSMFALMCYVFSFQNFVRVWCTTIFFCIEPHSTSERDRKSIIIDRSSHNVRHLANWPFATDFNSWNQMISHKT